MAVLSFKNEQGRWEIVESPGALKYYKQTLADAEKAQARENIDVYSTSEIDDKMSLLDDFNEDLANLYTELNKRVPMPEDTEFDGAGDILIPAYQNDDSKEISYYRANGYEVVSDGIVQRDDAGDILLPVQDDLTLISEGDNDIAVSGRIVKMYVDAQIAALETRLKAYIDETILNGEW